MKKLMIAAAIACVAAISQAASVEWQFNETVMNTSSYANLTTYTAYLFTATTWEGFTGSAADKQTSENFGKLSSTASTAINTKAKGSSRTVYMIGETSGDGTLSATGDSGNYYIILADSKGYFASEKLAATSYTDPTSSHDAAAWNVTTADEPLLTSTKFYTADPEPTPEPTSAMLMLLGMAGLALKRKRA